MTNKGFTHESARNITIDWYTPRYIFAELGIEFDIDVCSPGRDIVPWIPARKHLTINEDGLKAKWHGTVWCNPPYNRQTPKWLKRMLEHNNGIAFVFGRTDTQWFHLYCRPANAILFIEGRVKFIRFDQVKAYLTGQKVKNAGSGAGSMLVAYGDKCEKALFRAQKLGPVFKYQSKENLRSA